MYRQCPACAHTLPAGARPGPSCPACGLVYAKWMKQRFAAPAAAAAAAPRAATLASRAAAWLASRALHCEEHVNPFLFAGRALVLLGLVSGTGWFALQDHATVSGGSNPIGESFLHDVNLVFHEAGHVLFIPLGRFMSVLGGSLGQLLMPAVVTAVFLLRHANAFGAAVGLWWLGQSAVDLSVYIADARAGKLLLLGGITGQDAPGYHDWTSILSRLGWLEHDHAIAGGVFLAGCALMALACGWGATLLRLQWRHLDRRF